MNLTRHQLKVLFKEIIPDSFRQSGKIFLFTLKLLFPFLFVLCAIFWNFELAIFSLNIYHEYSMIVLIAIVLDYIIVFGGLVSLETWRRYFLFKRDSVYGRAISYLSEGFACIHALNRKGDEITAEELKRVLTNFCDYLQKIFNYKTRSRCGVSIKVVTSKLQPSDFKQEVRDLVRDSESAKRYSNSPTKKGIHFIYNNTCFYSIILNWLSKKRDRLYFLCNDLPGLKDYQNSSFLLRTELSEKAKVDERVRRREWSLDYRSELVVALSPVTDSKELSLIGFICIDCALDRREIFNKEFDVPLVQGVADGVYDLIKKYFVATEGSSTDDVPFSSSTDSTQILPKNKSKKNQNGGRKSLKPDMNQDLVKILYCTANPDGQLNLRLDKELREVKDNLSISELNFLLEIEPAVDIRAITKALETHQPQIVHFSGHGSSDGGLIIEGRNGMAKKVTVASLDRLFRMHKEKTKCVVLNACYSEELAKAISKHDIYVVGMNDAIGDEEAIEFSVGFYQGLSNGDFMHAFEIGMIHHLSNSNSAGDPKLWFQGIIISN